MTTAAKLVRYITEGQPVAFTWNSYVCEVNCLWDSLWQRAHDAANRLSAFAQRCEALRATPGLRASEKQRLRTLAFEHNALAGLARSIPDSLYMAAQEDFTTVLGPAGSSEPFWDLVTHRPGIEYTWRWTLRRVYHHAFPRRTRKLRPPVYSVLTWDDFPPLTHPARPAPIARQFTRSLWQQL